MKRFFIIFFIMLLVFSGCTMFKPKEEKTAQELAKQGTEDFNNGDYHTAIEAFENLRDWYPFSKFAILAELKIADAHYHLKQYEEAVLAYEEFENLHPSNEATPYVVFQIGLCFFTQIDTVDRDQNSAKKALTTFRRLKKQFPEDPYAGKADEYITKCLKSLAGNELYVGLYYYKTKHYKAALKRFKTIITDYPDVGTHQQALAYIPLCEAALMEAEAAK